ncbi:Crp/Fnr family transcriptional regulator [Flavobacterium sp.]|uniref:Crp/Fnr family transcriptional regulator n=1 Tax=Flavobacterium sp. TaxID=239 RepID=UPI00286E7C16|nr:Crp/Fnr family transcriptional regulator [Flavobacterium sp.]
MKIENNLHQFLINVTPISEKDFENGFQYFRKIILKKGEYFVKENTICKQIAFINFGSLRIFYSNENLEDTTSCFCTENNLTSAYKSFIVQEPSKLSIQALEETELWVITYDDLQKLYVESPIWGKIGRLIAEREYIGMEKYASVLNNETAKIKYLRLMNEQPQIIQKVANQYIASYLGITNRTLSRIKLEISKEI